MKVVDVAVGLVAVALPEAEGALVVAGWAGEEVADAAAEVAWVAPCWRKCASAAARSWLPWPCPAWAGSMTRAKIQPRSRTRSIAG
ncbi:MAG: hypothetical protein U0232_03770 [Thermomicrobiales bacterium]